MIYDFCGSIQNFHKLRKKETFVFDKMRKMVYNYVMKVKYICVLRLVDRGLLMRIISEE